MNQIRKYGVNALPREFIGTALPVTGEYWYGDIFYLHAGGKVVGKYRYDNTWILHTETVQDLDAVLLKQQEIIETLKHTLEASVDTGTATGGSTTTLVDTTKNWEANIWNNALVEVAHGDTHYIVQIASHTADTLTFAALAVTLEAGDKYWIKIPIAIQDIERWGGTALTGRDISVDLQALTDDAIKGVLKSLGDAGVGDNVLQVLGKIMSTSGIKKITDDVSLKAETTKVIGVVKLAGETLLEQLTELDLAGGNLTFSGNIEAIEIYNVDEVNFGTFNVNGISIVVPPITMYKALIAGTPSAVVSVTGSTAFIVSRYR